jgi:hypothetical protein
MKRDCDFWKMSLLVKDLLDLPRVKSSGDSVTHLLRDLAYLNAGVLTFKILRENRIIDMQVPVCSR